MIQDINIEFSLKTFKLTDSFNNVISCNCLNVYDIRSETPYLEKLLSLTIFTYFVISQNELVI